MNEKYPEVVFCEACHMKNRCVETKEWKYLEFDGKKEMCQISRSSRCILRRGYYDHAEKIVDANFVTIGHTLKTRPTHMLVTDVVEMMSITPDPSSFNVINHSMTMEGLVRKQGGTYEVMYQL